MTKLFRIKLMLYITYISLIHMPAPGNAESLLARLYRKAQNSHRPLIVILDNSYLKEKTEKPGLVKPNPLLTSDETVLDPSIFGPSVPRDPHVGVKKKHKPTVKTPVKRPAKTNKKKKSFRAIDDVQYDDNRSPIVKSLLRISNNLRCGARDECRDICKDRYSGVKKQTCVIKCEVTYECKVVEEDSCRGDECNINSCDSGDCEEQSGSTKGYAMSNEMWCQKGRC